MEMKFFKLLDILHPAIVRWPEWRKYLKAVLFCTGYQQYCCFVQDTTNNVVLFNERRLSPSPAVVVKVSLALRQLVVMVGKLQVITTTTNKECEQRGKR